MSTDDEDKPVAGDANINIKSVTFGRLYVCVRNVTLQHLRLLLLTLHHSNN